MLYYFRRVSLLPSRGLDVVHAPDAGVVAVRRGVGAMAVPTRGAVAVKYRSEATEVGQMHTVEIVAVVCPKAVAWRPPTCVTHVLLESVEGEAWVCGSVGVPMVLVSEEVTERGRKVTFRYKGVWPMGRVLWVE